MIFITAYAMTIFVSNQFPKHIKYYIGVSEVSNQKNSHMTNRGFRFD